MPGHTKSCICHEKSSLQTCRSAPKYNLCQESSALPPNISDEHVSCIVPATRHASFQVPFKCPTHAIVSGPAINPWLRRFVHFDLEMCFAPHPRAIFHLSSAQMAAALASLLFDPPEPQNIWKTVCFVTFLSFRAPASSFLWLFLFSDFWSSSLLFSDSSHLCFSSVHIAGSLTSKLPSTIHDWLNQESLWCCWPAKTHGERLMVDAISGETCAWNASNSWESMVDVHPLCGYFILWLFIT